MSCVICNIALQTCNLEVFGERLTWYKGLGYTCKTTMDFWLNIKFDIYSFRVRPRGQPKQEYMLLFMT